MKRSIVLFVLLSAFVVGVCMVNAACGASLSRTESDDVLDGIQKKIELAMNNCFVQNTAAPLDSLFTKLNKLEDGNGMVPYWKAYITYYKSVFYLKLGKKEDSGKVIKEASAILNDIGYGGRKNICWHSGKCWEGFGTGLYQCKRLVCIGQ